MTEKTIYELQTQLNSKDLTILECQEDLEKLKLRFKNLTEYKTTIMNQLQENDYAMTNVQKELSERIEKQKADEVQIKTMSKTLLELQGDKELLQEKINNLKENITKLVIKNASLEQELEAYKEKLEKSQGLYVAINNNMKQFKEITKNQEYLKMRLSDFKKNSTTIDNYISRENSRLETRYSRFQSAEKDIP